MEANFFKSLEIVLKHEGGFVDHPEDPGGATNKGITHKTYSDFLGRPLEDVSELKNIPDEHVQKIYKDGYWDRVKADQLSSGVDFCIFDWAVNSGPGRAAKALQKAVWFRFKSVSSAVALKLKAFVCIQREHSLIRAHKS